MVTAKEIYDYIDSFAPFETAMSFDNVGILIGDSDICADKALLALDITSEIINEAVEKGISLIVTHHPIIFSPLRAVSSISLYAQESLLFRHIQILIYVKAELMIRLPVR